MERKELLQAIQGALDFIEAKHGHRGGDVYGDLAKAKMHFEQGDVTDDGLIRQTVVKQPGHGPYLWALVWKSNHKQEPQQTHITVFSDWMDLAAQRKRIEENGHEVVTFDLAVDNCRRPGQSEADAANFFEVSFEWSGDGNRFRLVACDWPANVLAAGEWQPLYQGIATLEHAGRKWIGVTEYFDGVLPTERAIEILAR